MDTSNVPTHLLSVLNQFCQQQPWPYVGSSVNFSWHIHHPMVASYVHSQPFWGSVQLPENVQNTENWLPYLNLKSQVFRHYFWGALLTKISCRSPARFEKGKFLQYLKSGPMPQPWPYVGAACDLKPFLVQLSWHFVWNWLIGNLDLGGCNI